MRWLTYSVKLVRREVMASHLQRLICNLSNVVVSVLLRLPQSHGGRKRLQPVFGFDRSMLVVEW